MTRDRRDTHAGMIAQFIETCGGQKYAAMHYAIAIEEHHNGTPEEFEERHWVVLNDAIKRRWPKGLPRVKQMAWAMREGRMPWPE